MAVASLQCSEIWSWLGQECGKWCRSVMQCGYFSSQGLIYSSVLRSAQHGLKKSATFLLLERLAHNKFLKWQNSFLSLSFPLSFSPPFSLPHPRATFRGGWWRKWRELTCKPIMNFDWLAQYLSGSCLAHTHVMRGQTRSDQLKLRGGRMH